MARATVSGAANPPALGEGNPLLPWGTLRRQPQLGAIARDQQDDQQNDQSCRSLSWPTAGILPSV